MSSMELLQLGVLGPILTTVSGVEDITVQPVSLIHMHPQSHTGTNTKACTHETVDTLLPAPQNLSGMLDMLIVLYCTASLSLKNSLYTQELYSFSAGLEGTKGKPGWYNELLLPEKEKSANYLHTEKITITSSQYFKHWNWMFLADMQLLLQSIFFNTQACTQYILSKNQMFLNTVVNLFH